MAVSDKISLNIKFLDNTESTFSVQGKSTGSALLQGVIRDMNLIEADYFGLSFQDKHGNDNFLNPSKKIKLQLPNANNQALKFVVKFFPPDPGQLHEEFTKYLFVLQIRNDIEHEKLICNEETLATLIAYFVQADFGDWNEEDCSDSSYLKNVKIWPKGYSFDNRASKIVELHKSFLGLSPANAESQILSIACKLELYGIRKHLAHDHENSEIYLAVTHEGVIVLQGNSKINTFNWSRVRKLSFKKKRFLIKLKPETNSENLHGNVIVFLMESRDACKSFWRECLEHHAFFRMDTRPEPMVQPRLLKRGSTFRYSGKTQRQLTEFVRNNPLRRTDFVRVSRRKNLSLRSANSTKTTPTYSTTASNKILEMQPRVSKQEISDNTEEKNMKSQASKQITNISSEVSQPWEIDSGNLHSTAVSATPKEDHEEQSEPGNGPFHDMDVRSRSCHDYEHLEYDSCQQSTVINENNSNSGFQPDNSIKCQSCSASLLAQNLRFIDSLSSKSSVSLLADDSFFECQLKESFLQDDLFDAPPLPPKVGPVNPINSHAACRYSTNCDQSRVHSTTFSQFELNIPELDSMYPLSPSQYSTVEKKLIKAGFYSVPSKPPIIPEFSGTKSNEMGDEVAMNEFFSLLDKSFKDTAVADRFNEKILKTASTRSSATKDLFAPIPMVFDDYYFDSVFHDSCASTPSE